MKSRKIQIALAVVIGLVFLYLFARDMNWSEVWSYLIQAKYGYVILAVLLQYVAMWIRAIRWRIFLGAPWVSTGRLFMIANIGFMGNGVLPARLGELIRPFLVWRGGTHSFPTALATIVVERVFDLLGLLLILAYVLYVFPFPATTEVQDMQVWVKGAGYAGLGLFLVLCVVIGFMAYAPALSLRLAETFTRPLPHIIRSKLLMAVESFERGASVLRNPSSALYCLVLTLLLWIEIAFSELVVLWAFDLNHIDMTGALFLMVGLCFAVMFPQAPGYLGIYQWAMEQILIIFFAVNESIAKATAIVMWFSQVPPIILMGFVCLVIMGISFKDITHVQEEIPEETEESMITPVVPREHDTTV